MKRNLLFICLIALLFAGCAKEQNRKLLKAYFKYEINGVTTEIKDEILLKDNVFDCYTNGDSLLYVHVTKVYEGAGFIIRTKEGFKSGSYTLDAYNKGYYEDPKDKRIYYTNDTYKGSLTLQTGTFQGQTLINTLHGTFEFEGVDVTTGKKFKLEKGEFLMELKKK